MWEWEQVEMLIYPLAMLMSPRTMNRNLLPWLQWERETLDSRVVTCQTLLAVTFPTGLKHSLLEIVARGKIQHYLSTQKWSTTLWFWITLVSVLLVWIGICSDRSAQWIEHVVYQWQTQISEKQTFFISFMIRFFWLTTKEKKQFAFQCHMLI